jgi:hypothetical protein
LSKFLNRQFPDFSPQDFSVFIKTLFAGEILESRRKMVEFAKFEAPKQPASNPAAYLAPPEKADSTNTQNTKTEMEASDPSIDFGNAEHRAKPSFLNPNTPKAKVTPPPMQNPSPQGAAAQSGAQNSTGQPPEPKKDTLRPNGTLTARPPAQPAPRKQEQLSVDRNGNGYVSREQTFAGSTRSSAQPMPGKSPFMSIFSLIVAGCLLGGAAYYFANPKRASSQAYQTLAQWGLYSEQTEQKGDQASEAPRASKVVDVFITSTPSGAPIELDGSPTGEVTPATLSLPKGKVVRVSMRLASYLPSPFEEKFKVESARTIDAKFKSDKKGFLNVLVRGEGQIYINNRMVASTSPARMIAVPADENVTVTVYDPKTKATDQAVTTVNEGATRTITLTPRAAQVP